MTTFRGYGLGDSPGGAAAATAQAPSSSVYSGSKKREPFYKQGAIALPAVGATAAIVSQLVEPGRNGFLWKIAVDYVGAGFVEGSGAIIYRIFRNQALTRVVKGFDNLTASIGAVNNPLEIPAIQIYENELISIAVTNVGLVVGGAQLIGALVGYMYPRQEEDASRWP